MQNNHNIIVAVVFRVEECHLLWYLWRRTTLDCTVLILTLLVIFHCDIKSGWYFSSAKWRKLWEARFHRCWSCWDTRNSSFTLNRVLSALIFGCFLFRSRLWWLLFDWWMTLDSIDRKHYWPTFIWIESFSEWTYFIISIVSMLMN